MWPYTCQKANFKSSWSTSAFLTSAHGMALLLCMQNAARLGTWHQKFARNPKMVKSRSAQLSTCGPSELRCTRWPWHTIRWEYTSFLTGARIWNRQFFHTTRTGIKKILSWSTWSPNVFSRHQLTGLPLVKPLTTLGSKLISVNRVMTWHFRWVKMFIENVVTWHLMAELGYLNQKNKSFSTPSYLISKSSILTLNLI